jgi:hypothetical protein
MNRDLKNAVFINALLILFFIGTNFSLWNILNAHHHIIGSLGVDVFWIHFYQKFAYSANEWVPLDDSLNLFNLPFWVFFVAIAVNLFLLYRTARVQVRGQN